MRKKTVNDFKHLIGQTFNWLTVVDIIETDKGIRRKCICKCGKECLKRADALKSLRIMSCGCYVLSEECLARKSDSLKQYYRDNPDMLLSRVEKQRLWRKNNPEKLKEQGKRLSEYLQEHPDMVKSRGEQHSKWFKNNPDKVSSRSEHFRQTLKEKHPNYSDECKIRYNTWKETNPDAFNEMLYNQRNTKENNPECSHKISESAKAACLKKRLFVDYSSLIDVIHPSHLEQLYSGEIYSSSIVKTKCPVCGEYDYHKMNDVFNYKKQELKRKPMLCAKCASSYTKSRYEDELANFIKSFYDEAPIRNSRSIISPKELDLYYPEKNIAIEFNGDYFHSIEHISDKSYHYSKFKNCYDKGITLVSVFEYEWNTRKDEIKSYIKDLFNGIENSISFNEDHSLMNNNYPCPMYKIENEFVEDFYVHDHRSLTVYTCGHSKIIKEI